LCTLTAFDTHNSATKFGMLTDSLGWEDFTGTSTHGGETSNRSQPGQLQMAMVSTGIRRFQSMLLIAVSYRRCGRNLRAKLDTVKNAMTNNQQIALELMPESSITRVSGNVVYR